MKMMVSWSHDLSHVGASDSALFTGYRGLIRRWGHVRGFGELGRKGHLFSRSWRAL